MTRIGKVRTALIIGGGIAGPVAAMALHHAGLEAAVYEAYDSTADGAGGAMTIAPNGQNALDAIGAGDLVRDIGTPVTAMGLRSWTGKHLAQFAPPSRLPSLQFVWRADLYRAIYDEAERRSVPIHHGKRLTDTTDTDSGVTAHFADGTQASADILIGADGIRSTVRPLIDPVAPQPNYAGLVCFGARMHQSGLPSTNGVMYMCFGKRAFFGYQVFDDSSAMWFVNLPHVLPMTVAAAQAIGAKDWMRTLQTAFALRAGRLHRHRKRRRTGALPQGPALRPGFLDVRTTAPPPRRTHHQTRRPHEQQQDRGPGRPRTARPRDAGGHEADQPGEDGLAVRPPHRLEHEGGPAHLNSSPSSAAAPGTWTLCQVRHRAWRLSGGEVDAFPQIDGVGILLTSTRVLLSDLERYDAGFFIACLCTPLLGADLAEQLPRYRPTGLLARETNGDLALVLPRWRAKAVEVATDADRQTLSCLVGRRIVRTGFTLIMPRWGGWTSDLDQSAELFGRYYPERAEQMRIAASIGRAPSPDPAVLEMLIDDLGPWLAAEYTAVHGEKTPRP